MVLKVECENSYYRPSYSSDGAAGLDLKSIEDVEIGVGCSELIATGIRVEIPRGYYGAIRGRSGLAAKYGLIPFHGTIDEDYRGEIKVLIFNYGKKPYWIRAGDRIAQMIIQPYSRVEIKEVNFLEETERGTKGFGSTGV